MTPTALYSQIPEEPDPGFSNPEPRTWGWKAPAPFTSKLMKPFLLPFLIFMSLSAQETSELWGNKGEKWDPANSRLRDFTQVGYKGGEEPIPFWPVGVKVTDFGAIPNDGIDDSQAFLAAIAACPPRHAVLIPRGTFTILQRIVIEKDHIVLRGEDLYESVIFFPKYLGEVNIQEIGFGNKAKPIYDKFFVLEGGTEKGIENLTFSFREQRLKGVWEYEGAGAVDVNYVTDSWVRNVVFLNYSSGISVNATRSSFINLIFDQFNGRCGTDYASTQNLDAYGSVLPRNCSYNLFHNIRVEGAVLQPIDLNESSSHNVYSHFRGGERLNRSIAYHGGKSSFNLYTDLDKGVVQPKAHPSRKNETYWNVHDTYEWTRVKQEVVDSENDLIFVGYGTDFPAKTQDPNLWYEPAEFGQITPNNLYLAQLAYFGKPMPTGLARAVPSRFDGDVFAVVPDDDLKVDDTWYYRFDLSEAKLTNVAGARLRVHMDNRRVGWPPYTFHAWTVTEDSWSEDTLTSDTTPDRIAEIDSRLFAHKDDNRVLEFDVTAFARDQLVGGDGVVSLALTISSDRPGLPPVLWEAEKGTKPELIVERVPSSVPGPPVAPRNIGTTSRIGNILLDWEDHPEPGVTYTVYRNPYKVNPKDGSVEEGYGEYIDNGLVTSDIADIQSSMNWRPGQMYHGVVYRYKISAVDDHGYESPRSEEIFAATLHPENKPPVFAQTLPLPRAIVGEDYRAQLGGAAQDPETDPLYFHIASGPAWLHLSPDGLLSGKPEPGDVGNVAVTLQVTAIGGSAQKTVTLRVDPAGL